MININNIDQESSSTNININSINNIDNKAAAPSTTTTTTTIDNDNKAAVSTTTTPCIYHHVNPFASNCHDYPPHEFVLHCPNELLPEMFHAIQSAINGQVRALSTWIMQFNINYALPSVCESTISSAAISMKSVKLQCHGGRHAHQPYVYKILQPNDRTNRVYIDIDGLNEPSLEHYHIFPVNDDVLSASASPNYVTYATYANNFITQSIVTTMTSLVFYSYEFDELSTNDLTMSAFQLQLSWTMTIIVVAAYVLMIAANGILLQTKVSNFCNKDIMVQRSCVKKYISSG